MTLNLALFNHCTLALDPHWHVGGMNEAMNSPTYEPMILAGLVFLVLVLFLSLAPSKPHRAGPSSRLELPMTGFLNLSLRTSDLLQRHLSCAPVRAVQHFVGRGDEFSWDLGGGLCSPAESHSSVSISNTAPLHS